MASFNLPETFAEVEYKSGSQKSNVPIRYKRGGTGELWFQVLDNMGKVNSLRYVKAADAKHQTLHYIDLACPDSSPDTGDYDDTTSVKPAVRRMRISFKTHGGYPTIDDAVEFDAASNMSEHASDGSVAKVLHEQRETISMLLTLAREHVPTRYRNAHDALEKTLYAHYTV